MKVYTYSDARQRLAEVLNIARKEHDAAVDSIRLKSTH